MEVELVDERLTTVSAHQALTAGGTRGAEPAGRGGPDGGRGPAHDLAGRPGAPVTTPDGPDEGPLDVPWPVGATGAGGAPLGEGPTARDGACRRPTRVLRTTPCATRSHPTAAGRGHRLAAPGAGRAAHATRGGSPPWRSS